MSILNERLKKLEAFLSTKSPQDIVNEIQSYPATGPFINEFIESLDIGNKLTPLNECFKNLYLSEKLDLSKLCVNPSCFDENKVPTGNVKMEFLSISDWSSDGIAFSANDDAFDSNDIYSLVA